MDKSDSDYTNPEIFSRLYWLFSREAVTDGSIEKRAIELPKPRGKAIQGSLFKGGYQSVDEAFLEQLDEYREVLAKAFKKSNPGLHSEELTEAIQRTIDRLVFIRFLEDKQIEQEEIIGLRSKKNAWQAFLAHCQHLEPKYNGLIFKPHPLLENKLFVPPDDETFVNICDELADPTSPYDFDQIPISILGSIYERFLGKVVHATDKRVKVEEKPEVRKAGGVYYTPEYIVRYIVKETVGEQIEGKTPTEVSKMAFADLSCGSGSFLIEVYNYLLEYHIRYYTEHPDEATSDDVFLRDGILRLTLKKKKEVLLNNIYGVDIDYQATEVTQFSLYLKLLEHATMQDAHQFGLFKERILPDLRENIMCGNSLIGRDIIDGQLFSNIDESKLKPMNFEDAFPKIMKRGGFDAIVGNPPYIPIEAMSDSEKQYYRNNYSQLQRKYDSSVIFILAGLAKLNNKGCLGFISSITWQTGENYSLLRKYLFEKGAIKRLVNLPYNVFGEAYVDTGIYIFAASSKTKYNIYRYPKKKAVTSLEKIEFTEVDISLVSPPEYKVVLDSHAAKFMRKFSGSSKYTELGNITDSTQGLAGNMYVTEPNKNIQSMKFFEKGQVYRYNIVKTEISYTDMEDKKSLVKYYLPVPKILIRRVINREDRLMATFFDEEMIFKKDINPFIIKGTELSPFYILGILNSKLISYLYINTSSIATKNDFRQTTLAELRRLPIRIVDFTHISEKAIYDKIVKNVSQLIESRGKLSISKTEAEINRLTMYIASLDHQIDESVYVLYGLTQDERKIIESETLK